MTLADDGDRWRAQIALAFTPSFACNLRCRHCFAPTDDPGPAWTAGDLDRLLDDAAGLGLRSLELTGGELFLYEHVARLLDRLATVGLPTAILTNGTLVEEHHVARLAGTQVALRLSIDGPEAVHDGLRGRGAFTKARRAAGLCRTAGVPFDLGSTVTRTSLPHVADTVEVALELGARGIHFAPLHRLGGRSAQLAREQLDEAGCVELAATLTALRDRAPEGFDLSWRSMTMRAVAVMHPCSVYACWGALCLSPKHWPNELTVLPDGEVLPQSPHIHRRYSLGNALREGLDEVVRRYWGSRRHDEFRRLCRHIYQDLIYGRDDPLLLWDELVHEASQRPVEELPDHDRVSHPHDHGAEIEQARRDGTLDRLIFPLAPR